MAFEDDAKELGSDFLYLIGDNLRERSRYVHNWGINVPYSSFDKQWASLISQIGLVDAVKKSLRKFIDTVDTKALSALRRAAKEAIPDHEITSYNLWTLVDSETRRATKLAVFVLRYGISLSVELGRLSAFKIYQLGACINRLLEARVSDKVVLEDGMQERYGDRTVLGNLKHLERLIQECGLAQLEQERLGGLIQSFEERYTGGDKIQLSYEDHPRLLRVLDKIEAVVSQEIRIRDFSELRPVSGILDYQKLPSQVLDGLLGDIAYTVVGLVRQDLEESIRCLRFGTPTASVMVGLRAVEGWLRELHYGLTGEKTRKGWANLLEDIGAILSDRGVSMGPVTGFLNYIRDVRNKADHPDETFSQVEAEQVFVAATTAIREIEKLKPATP